jgi:hypothetical protein
MIELREKLLYLLFSERGLSGVLFCLAFLIWIRVLLPVLRDALKDISHYSGELLDERTNRHS